MLLLEDLKEYMKGKELIEVYYDDSNTQNFIVGFIIQVDNLHCILQLVTPEGNQDGYLLIGTDEIFSVVSKSRYLKKIMTLIMNKQVVREVDFNLKDKNLIDSFIDYILNNKYVARIYLLGSQEFDFQGIISNKTSTKCKLQQITDYGEMDGVCSILTNTITRISANGEYEQSLKTLYEINKENCF